MSVTTPTKRVFTEAAHALNSASTSDALSATYVPHELSADLANVGRKVRQAVQQGYKTDRVLGIAGSRYASDDTNIGSSSSGGGATPYIFRSDVDTLEAAKFSYSNQTPGLPRFCDSGTEPTWGPAGLAREAGKKRGTRGLDEDEAAEAGDLMDLNAPLTNRLIRAAPRRTGLARNVAVSMPVGAFSFSGGAVSTTTPAAAATPASLLVQPAPGGSTAPEGVDFEDLFNEEF